MSDSSLMLDVILAYMLPTMVWLLAMLLGLGLAVIRRGPGLCLMGAGAVHLGRLLGWAAWQGWQTRAAMQGEDLSEALGYGMQGGHMLLLLLGWLLLGAAVLGWRGGSGQGPSEA